MLYQTYRDRAAFLFVYIDEAHPSDGWQMEINEKEDVVFELPKSYDRRAEIAAKCCSSLKLTMPCVVDTIDNAVDEAYAGWPERMFIVDRDGRVAYAGKPGPWGFRVDEVEKWLKKHAAK